VELRFNASTTDATAKDASAKDKISVDETMTGKLPCPF